MNKTLCFLIADKDEPEDALGVVINVTNPLFSFDSLIGTMSDLIRSEECQDKFYSAGASDEVEYDLVQINGVCLFRFIYSETIYYHWSSRVVNALKKVSGIDVRQVLRPDALAAVLLNTGPKIELGDITGEWRGIAVMEARDEL